MNPDGTLSPFVIPEGKSEENINVNYAIVDSLAPGSSDGRAGASLVVTGVAISAGTPCWGVNDISRLGSADALVHGFLAVDR